MTEQRPATSRETTPVAGTDRVTTQHHDVIPAAGGQPTEIPFVYLGDIVPEEMDGKVRIKIKLDQLDREALAEKAEEYESVEVHQVKGRTIIVGDAEELRELLKVVEVEATPAEIASFTFEYQLEMVEAQPLQNRVLSKQMDVASATVNLQRQSLPSLTANAPELASLSHSSKKPAPVSQEYEIASSNRPDTVPSVKPESHEAVSVKKALSSGSSHYISLAEQESSTLLEHTSFTPPTTHMELPLSGLPLNVNAALDSQLTLSSLRGFLLQGSASVEPVSPAPAVPSTPTVAIHPVLPPILPRPEIPTIPRNDSSPPPQFLTLEVDGGVSASFTEDAGTATLPAITIDLTNATAGATTLTLTLTAAAQGTFAAVDSGTATFLDQGGGIYVVSGG
jgi:hypothetical protein